MPLARPQRMAWALGVDELEELNERLARLIDPRLPERPGPGASTAGATCWARCWRRGSGRRRSKPARCRTVFHQGKASLDFLPILKCWPKDGGRFITLPQVITRNPQTGARNVGMYRLQVVDQLDPAGALAAPQGRRGARNARQALAAGAHPGGGRPGRRPGFDVVLLRPAARPKSMNTCWPATCAADRLNL